MYVFSHQQFVLLRRQCTAVCCLKEMFVNCLIIFPCLSSDQCFTNPFRLQSFEIMTLQAAE